MEKSHSFSKYVAFLAGDSFWKWISIHLMVIYFKVFHFWEDRSTTIVLFVESRKQIFVGEAVKFCLYFILPPELYILYSKQLYFPELHFLIQD